MKLIYTSAAKDNIEVTLDQGETLGNIRGPSNFFVPVLAGNKEYDDIVKKNLTVENSLTVSVKVPYEVTPLQARKAIRSAGLAEKFRTEMSKASYEVQEEWEYATVIERNNPLISAFTKKLGMTEKQIDDLFIFAASL